MASYNDNQYGQVIATGGTPLPLRLRKRLNRYEIESAQNRAIQQGQLAINKQATESNIAVANANLGFRERELQMQEEAEEAKAKAGYMQAGMTAVPYLVSGAKSLLGTGGRSVVAGAGNTVTTSGLTTTVSASPSTTTATPALQSASAAPALQSGGAATQTGVTPVVTTTTGAGAAGAGAGGAGAGAGTTAAEAASAESASASVSASQGAGTMGAGTYLGMAGAGYAGGMIGGEIGGLKITQEATPWGGQQTERKVGGVAGGAAAGAGYGAVFGGGGIVVGAVIGGIVGGISQSVICTELYRQGKLSEEIYLLDSEFRKTITDEVYIGYRVLADPVVRLMQQSSLATRIISWVAIPWAMEMAHVMKPESFKGNILGKAVMKLGIPICRFIGKRRKAVCYG